jgi:hypothetical protein
MPVMIASAMAVVSQRTASPFQRSLVAVSGWRRDLDFQREEFRP